MNNRLPSGWSIKKIKEIGQIVTGTTPSTTNPDYWGGDVPFISPSDFNSKISIGNTERFLTSYGAKKGRLLPPNSVLVTCIGSIGGVALNAKKSVTNQQINAIIPHHNIVNRFCLYSILFNVDELRKNAGLTTLPIINKSTFENIKVITPPLAEQKKIATILTAVDTVIEKTEAQIEKLQLLKKGMMQELLTKGIGHTEFKDSPLGRIPKGWVVTTCEEVCKEIVVGIVIKPSQYYTKNGIRALRSANVRETGLNNDNMIYISQESNNLLRKSKVSMGDIVTVRTGYPGTSAVVTKQFEGSNCIDLIISRPSSKVNSYFLSNWINSDFGRGLVLQAQGGLAQQHFNVGDMKKLLVVLPSLTEQERIVSIIETINEKKDIVINKLEKYRFLKKAIMQDLLTGKVRVKID